MNYFGLEQIVKGPLAPPVVIESIYYNFVMATLSLMSLIILAVCLLWYCSSEQKKNNITSEFIVGAMIGAWAFVICLTPLYIGQIIKEHSCPILFHRTAIKSCIDKGIITATQVSEWRIEAGKLERSERWN